ncbi:MAG: peptidoglycan bridge formation glycyltransferase FemA/FemB family protein [Anaerolineae bacterium]|nr:peptidoglycan bridge formation glycyltransferase FemA/FemB family protein [Anaerolineae bacterium]
MIYRTETDSSAWNDALSRLPGNHVLQSWEWGQVKSAHNWTPTRLLWEQGGKPVAAAQVLRRPLPYTPWGIMYVPKGPALDYASPKLLQCVLDDLERFSRRQGAIFLKIDPDTNATDVVTALTARGWRYSDEQIQFRNTALLDLSPTRDALLAEMKSKTRYNIRLGERKGVTITPGSVEDIPLFYRLYAETGHRDGFLIRPLSYYQDAWQTFIQAGMAQMFLAQVEDEAVAGLILFRFGVKVWFMYGASTDKHRNWMPSYVLQWHAICWAKSVGCTVYDMWGAPDTLHENDRLWGVWRFKQGLGARYVPHIGAYDYPASHLLYWMYSVILPRYLNLLRRRHQPDVSSL